MKKKMMKIMISMMIVLILPFGQAEAKKEKITFKSKTVTTLANILDGLDEKDKDVDVWGFLEMPSAGWGKKIEGNGLQRFPAVMAYLDCKSSAMPTIW